MQLLINSKGGSVVNIIMFIWRIRSLSAYYRSHGLKPILKRRMLDEYGREHFVDASENEILNLQNQSRLAVTAHNLLNLSVEDRTFWAIEMKRQANELFRKGLFEEASAQYLEVCHICL